MGDENIIARFYESCILPRGAKDKESSPAYMKRKPIYRSPPKAAIPSYLHSRDPLPKTMKNPAILKRKKIERSDVSSDESFVEVVASASGNEEDYFEVEELRGKEMRNGKSYYLVKWWGYDDSQSTWEPIDHLKHAADYVRQFEYHN